MKIKLLLISLLLCSELSFAKRLPPVKIEPITNGGTKYSTVTAQDAATFDVFVLAEDVKTHKELWRTKLYSVILKKDLEKDVQEVFLASLKMEGDHLVAINEGKHKFQIDGKTGSSFLVLGPN